MALEDKVSHNLSNVKLWFSIPALLLLLSGIVIYFLSIDKDKSLAGEYIRIQKNIFLLLNHHLSEYANLQFNLTQLGNAIVLFSLLSIFILYTPKFWEALGTSSILSLIAAALLKEILTVPRPAEALNKEDFNVIGETLYGNASLPSGHSMTTFFVITTVLFSFMPKKKTDRIFWSLSLFILATIAAFSRVGVGAHYPLDVVSGSIIGYIMAILGITINHKIKWLRWFENSKYYPVFILLLLLCLYVIILKIMDTPLPIFYLSLCALLITLFIIVKTYVKKN